MSTDETPSGTALVTDPTPRAVIVEVLRAHGDGEFDRETLRWRCQCGETEGRDPTPHIATEIVKALGLVVQEYMEFDGYAGQRRVGNGDVEMVSKPATRMRRFVTPWVPEAAKRPRRATRVGSDGLTDKERTKLAEEWREKEGSFDIATEAGRSELAAFQAEVLARYEERMELHSLDEVGAEFGADLECHCGQAVLVQPDGFTRDLCRGSDAVRCDAYPGACA